MYHEFIDLINKQLCRWVAKYEWIQKLGSESINADRATYRPALSPFPLARMLREYLLRRPILSPGAAFLVRSPQRTAEGTPASPSLARSPGGLRSQPPRYGIPEESRPALHA